MTRPGKPRVGRLIAVQTLVAVAALLVAPAPADPQSPLLVVLTAAAFAVVGSAQMHIELRRHSCAVTLVEAVLVVALLWLAPVEVAIAAVLGEAMACIHQRQPLRQLLFNVSAAAAAVSVASAAFAFLTLGSRQPATLVVGALAAAICCGATSLVSTTTVLAVVERRRFREVLPLSVVPAAVAAVVSSSVGLVAVVLASLTPAAALLVLPLVAMMVLGTRGLAAQQAEQLRFERLYEASSRTGELQSLPAVMGRLAAEARSLVTGASALCATVAPGGSWEGVLVDDRGARPVPRHVLEAMLSVAQGTDGELPADDLPDALRQALQPVASLVVAMRESSAAAPVLLAVARSLPTDRGARTRTEVLGAFAGHAALTVANARLFADVEEALARQVDLNRQKDDFVAVVSHELRTPLTSMLGSVTTLRRMQERLTPQRRDLLIDMAVRQGHHLQQLIEELLLLATIDNGAQPDLVEKPVDLGSLLEELVADLPGGADTDPSPTRVEAQAGVAVVTDEGKLRRILVNLLENARKYAPGAPVEITVRQDAARTIIDVVDGGPGIRPEHRERVFERFVQLDQTATRAAGGTGLGLYLCRQLARVLGGSLVLSQNEGGGCCFTLTLPVSVVHLEAAPQPSAALALAGAGRSNREMS